MITFDINGAIVEFDENLDNYNSVRKLFKFYAKDCSQKFEEYCLNNFKSKKDLSENNLELANEYIQDGMRKAIETIVSYNVITVDFEIFKNTYCSKYLEYERLFNNLNKQELSSKSKRNSGKFYDIKPILKKLSRYLYEDCFNIHYAVVDALIENNVENISSRIAEDNKQKAKALFNNYKDGFISKPDECRVVKQIIDLNPYKKDVYEFLVKEDGDFNEEIARLTTYLGYNIIDYKNTLMDIYVKELIKKSSGDVEVDQEKIEKYAKYIGCKDCSVYLARIDAIYTFENV